MTLDAPRERRGPSAPSNPYADLPERAFWKSAVADRPYRKLSAVWRPKFAMSRADVFVTAGSCFAQHLSRALVKAGFDWRDEEPGPERCAPALKREHGYGVFSFRSGNIYTVAALRQWVEAAFGARDADPEFWETDGRVFDPMRPAIEPGGFASRAEAEAMRRLTLAAVRRALTEATVFVVTLGLTEAWRNRASGLVYAMGPGTLAGTFDPDAHAFVNFGYDEIRADLAATLDLLVRHNKGLRTVLTVSPVPLTATASASHVLVATGHSKAILRTVAGSLADRRADVDYFPAYEIVTSPAARGATYERNLRSVTADGVDYVMAQFFAGLDPADDPGAGWTVPPPRQPVAVAAPPPSAPATPARGETPEEVECEEALLDAFGPAARR